MNAVKNHLIGSAIILGAFAIFCPLFAFMFADGKVDHCYIQYDMMYGDNNTKPYRIIGHRPWRHDIVLGTFTTVEEAVFVTNIFGCFDYVKIPNEFFEKKESTL